MDKFFPDIYQKSIYDINYKKLKKVGIKCLLFDLDNTDDVEVLEAHLLLISSHLENYRELQVKGIDVLPFDYNGLYALQCALFNKLFDLY